METIIAPTLDKAITPLRPYLVPITRSLPAPLNSFLITLLGSPCHSALFRDLRFANTPEHACFSLLVSKTLGLAIIGVSSVVKIPQILKLLNSHSSDGISFLSYALETASFIISLAYNARSRFPFSTYGETALIAAQDVVVSVLVLHFAGRDAAAGVFVAGLAAVVYALFSGESLVDMQTLSYLQAGAGVLSVASKAPQIWTVWQQGGTGQLSAFAVFNYLAGSLSRIFTTLQEVDDNLILYGFVAGFILNLVLAIQMVYYWKSPATTAHAGEIGEKSKQLAMGESTGAESSPQKGKASRRRG